jgi:hypothetical protein
LHLKINCPKKLKNTGEIMKKSFITAMALGLVFAFGANAQIVDGTKKVVKVTKTTTVKGAKATKKTSVKVYKTTKRVGGKTVTTTKRVSVKGYKGAKKLVKKVF